MKILFFNGTKITSLQYYYLCSFLYVIMSLYITSLKAIKRLFFNHPFSLCYLPTKSCHTSQVTNHYKPKTIIYMLTNIYFPIEFMPHFPNNIFMSQNIHIIIIKNYSDTQKKEGKIKNTEKIQLDLLYTTTTYTPHRRPRVLCNRMASNHKVP